MSAATLDVAPEGADLVFTWDAGLDALLRGTDPATLTPWMVAVTPPLRVPGENLLRGEDAYYRLASGSNMAFRLERSFPAPTPTDYYTAFALTLPERHASVTSFDLPRLWPELDEVIWWDAADLRYESAIRVGALLLGDDESIPQASGVWAHFGVPITLTLVGSEDLAFAGPLEEDLGPGIGTNGLLAIPYNARWSRGFEILCGTAGTDWQDVDGDTLPDECGRDTTGDTLPDTGLWGGSTTTGAILIVVQADSAMGYVRCADPATGLYLLGPDFAMVPGQAYETSLCCPFPIGSPPILNVPFRPPRY